MELAKIMLAIRDGAVVNVITLCGTKIKLQFTDISNSRSRIGIWHGKQFITVK